MTRDELKAVREAYGLTQTEMAAALGIKAKHGGRTLRGWERGEQPLPDLLRLALRGLQVERGLPNGGDLG